MKLTPEQIVKLSEIIENLSDIRMEVTYPGYLEDRMPIEEVIGKIAKNLEDALEIILSEAVIEEDADHDSNLDIDYEDIYGWGGQDYSPR